MNIYVYIYIYIYISPYIYPNTYIYVYMTKQFVSKKLFECLSFCCDKLQSNFLISHFFSPLFQLKKILHLSSCSQLTQDCMVFVQKSNKLSRIVGQKPKVCCCIALTKNMQSCISCFFMSVVNKIQQHTFDFCPKIRLNLFDFFLVSLCCSLLKKKKMYNVSNCSQLPQESVLFSDLELQVQIVSISIDIYIYVYMAKETYKL